MGTRYSPVSRLGLTPSEGQPRQSDLLRPQPLKVAKGQVVSGRQSLDLFLVLVLARETSKPWETFDSA